MAKSARASPCVYCGSKSQISEGEKGGNSKDIRHPTSSSRSGNDQPANCQQARAKKAGDKPYGVKERENYG